MPKRKSKITNQMISDPVIGPLPSAWSAALKSATSTLPETTQPMTVSTRPANTPPHRTIEAESHDHAAPPSLGPEGRPAARGPIHRGPAPSPTPQAGREVARAVKILVRVREVPAAAHLERHDRSEEPAQRHAARPLRAVGVGNPPDGPERRADRPALEHDAAAHVREPGAEKVSRLDGELPSRPRGRAPPGARARVERADRGSVLDPAARRARPHPHAPV